MKKIDKLLIKSFIGPLILTFFITLFVLVMQFLWKYVDDLVGKGLEWYVLAELLFYASARLVPMALPLAVLLSSIMTFGNLGEHFELIAFKASGLSLLRIMRGLVIGVLFLSFFAFVFSNNVLPIANLKFGALLYDITHQKPTLNIKEGVFNNTIEGYSIRVDEKGEDGKTLHNLMIYNHTSGNGNDHVIIAEKGYMYEDDDQMSMVLKLFNGHVYKEIIPKRKEDYNYEHYQTIFKEWEMRFDLSQFDLRRTDERFFKDLHQMLNFRQLLAEIDTINLAMVKRQKTFNDQLKPYLNYARLDSSITSSTTMNNPESQYYRDFDEVPDTQKAEVLTRGLSKARNVKSYTSLIMRELDNRRDDLVDHKVELHRKFTLSIACLVLFFIGAPFGSIIRKGGLGWPLFWAVIFFVIFHVSSLIGEKLAEQGTLLPHEGMWMSTLILLPIGAFLTYKAKNDSALYNRETYVIFARKISKILGKKS